MEKFLKIMEKDILKDGFSRKELVMYLLYGGLLSVGLVLFMGSAGWLESL